MKKGEWKEKRAHKKKNKHEKKKLFFPSTRKSELKCKVPFFIRAFNFFSLVIFFIFFC